MTQVLAIDPGPEKSAWVIFDGANVGAMGYSDNSMLRCYCRGRYAIDQNPADRKWRSVKACHLALETIVNYGMPVGESTFTTMFWIGRFVEAWGNDYYTLLKRPDIKLHLCNSVRAKDANVRQALINRFGGSKRKAVGIKADPGPLYGLKSHIWSALAVAVTWADQEKEEEK